MRTPHPPVQTRGSRPKVPGRASRPEPAPEPTTVTLTLYAGALEFVRVLARERGLTEREVLEALLKDEPIACQITRDNAEDARRAYFERLDKRLSSPPKGRVPVVVSRAVGRQAIADAAGWGISVFRYVDARLTYEASKYFRPGSWEACRDFDPEIYYPRGGGQSSADTWWARD